jgi:hypothetical protein
MPINRRRKVVEGVDQNLLLIPVSFTINGTTTPDGLEGSLLESVAYTAAGKFTCTLRDSPYQVLNAIPSMGVVTADNIDIYAQCDKSGLASGGLTFVVKTKTGATLTDPPDDSVVDVLLVCRHAASGGTAGV